MKKDFLGSWMLNNYKTFVIMSFQLFYEAIFPTCAHHVVSLFAMGILLYCQAQLQLQLSWKWS